MDDRPVGTAGPGVVGARVDQRSRVTAEQRRQRRRWAVLGALLLVLLTGSHRGFFLYLALVVGGMGLLCYWLAVTSLWELRTTRQVSATEVEAGAEVAVTVTVTNGRGLPLPWLMLEDQAEGLVPNGPTSALVPLGPGKAHELRYVLPLPLRGFYRVGPLLLTSSGPLGLIRRFRFGSAQRNGAPSTGSAQRSGAPSTGSAQRSGAPSIEGDVRFVTVFPRSVPLGDRFALGQHPVHEVPRRRSLFEDPTRFMGVRDYQPTDGIRRVHWRASARAGTLQSRVYEPSVLYGLLLLLDLHQATYAAAGALARAADPVLELAVLTAASLAEHVLLGDQAVGLLANGADAAERYPAEWTGATFGRREMAVSRAAPRAAIRRRPVEVPARKGAWQRALIRAALARLVPTDGLSAAELLVAELGRLPRQLVLTVITPGLTAPLATALGAVRRAGIEAQVVWVGPPGTLPVGAPPQGVPLHVVTDEQELALLGGRRL